MTNDNKSLSIEPFKVPVNKLLLVLIGEFGFYFSLLIIGATLAFIVLGFFLGYRFFVLALLWIFIVVPLICFYLYIFHALKPISAYNSLLHSLEFKDNDLNITIYHMKKGTVMEKGNKIEEIRDADQEEKEEKTFTIKDFKIDKIKKGSSGISLFFNSPSQGVLLIPYSSFQSGSDIIALTEIVRTHLSN